ncbi:uncharacterized protein LOC128532305 isoform X2 [Clarias gariepinus]|uniref:uncharacterized protein LOC128532305 isoform X2 n=1 Tax=Clarias gariepinus TaxID=13013 RepID=UPI00234C78DA|nr:uncharacterized protein LOC128532305 isoform X2 [Clarias gariepinus]
MKMIEFWILILIFNTMYTVQRWVTAQSLTDSPVYQPDEELSVDIGDSATLRCCISENKIGIIALFKQPKRKQPHIMGTIFISAGEAFYSESQNSNFLIKRSSNCINITILKTTQSDEATYFCALITPNQFGDGTYLKIKGENVTIASQPLKPASYNNLTVYEQTLHGNSTNMNTQEKTGEENVKK